MPEPEAETELAKLQRRFEELMAEADRLAEAIRVAEEHLPKLESGATLDRDRALIRGADYWPELLRPQKIKDEGKSDKTGTA